MVNALPYGGPYLRMCHAQDLGSSEAGLDLLAALAALPLHIAPTAQEFKLLAGEVSHNLQRGILVTSRSIPSIVPLQNLLWLLEAYSCGQVRYLSYQVTHTS